MIRPMVRRSEIKKIHAGRYTREDKDTDKEFNETYRQMALDIEQEAEALEWAEATIGDVSDYDDEQNEDG